MQDYRVRYQTLEIGEFDIHLRTLRDKQQFSDVDGIAEKFGISSAQWSLFGHIWDSSKILAHQMATQEIEQLRILEVGCGMALSSLVLNSRNADITATDYHPEARAFLAENTRLNKGREIPFIRTGWADDTEELGKFDLIIGSDLLYEQEHAELLSRFINQHANQECEIIIIDPGRGNHAKFSKKMVLMGYTHSQNKPENQSFLKDHFKGQILNYTRQ